MFSRLKVGSDSHSSSAPKLDLHSFQRWPRLHKNQHLQQVVPAKLRVQWRQEKWCFEGAYLQAPL